MIVFLIQGELWLPSGTTIQIGSSNISFLSIQEVDESVVTSKLIASSSTVPVGKRWKITKVLPGVSLTGSKDFLISINGTTTYVGGVVDSRYNSQGVDGFSYYMLDGEIWLPEGTTLSPSTNVYGISVTEY